MNSALPIEQCLWMLAVPLALSLALVGCAHPAGAPAVQLDQPLQAVKTVPPRYPAEAKRTHAQGAVAVNVLVDEQGRVVDSTAAPGDTDRLLKDAASAAVRQWEYQPHTVDGQPVRARFVQVVSFRLQQP